MQTIQPNNQNAHHSITFTKTEIGNLVQAVQHVDGIRFYIGYTNGKLDVFGVPVINMGNVEDSGPQCYPGSDVVDPGFVLSGGHVEELIDFDQPYTGCGGVVNTIQDPNTNPNNNSSMVIQALQQYRSQAPNALQQLSGWRARAFDVNDLAKIFNDNSVVRIRIFFGIELLGSAISGGEMIDYLNMLIIGVDNQGRPVTTTPPNEAGPVLALSIPCPIHCDTTSFLCI